MKDGIERIVNGLCDANLGSAMSKKCAISRKSFVQFKAFCCFRLPFCLDQELENLRVLASLRDKFLFLVAALPR